MHLYVFGFQKMFGNRPGLFNNANTSFGMILLLCYSYVALC